jgi:hypothetical protein
MTTHILHADVLTHGLDSHCPRCREHAENPLASLDTAMLRRLSEGVYLSDLDRLAAERLGVTR